MNGYKKMQSITHRLAESIKEGNPKPALEWELLWELMIQLCGRPPQIGRVESQHFQSVYILPFNSKLASVHMPQLHIIYADVFDR